MDQPEEQTGITYDCIWYNQMRTYEESRFFLHDFVEPPASTEFSTKTTPEKTFMRVPILISLAAVLLTSWGLAAPYDELPARGYRWVSTNGPYACRSKDDLRQIINNHTDLTEVQMIEESRAYYLIKGAIVQVVLEDAAAGMSQIHSAEIGPDVWTLTRFLSKRPVRSPDGEIEVPGRSVAPHT
jgi:hypothetical protein